MIGKILYDKLSNDPALQLIVGNRIYPILVPQNSEFPAITYERVSTEILSIKGYDKMGDDIDIQLNIFSDSYTELLSIAQLVKAALDFQQKFQFEDIHVSHIVLKAEQDGIFDYELNLYHRILTFEISIDTYDVPSN